jgi:hypothetical protein
MAAGPRSRSRRSTALGVAGQHDHVLDAGAAQLHHRRSGLRTRPVGKPEHRERVPALAEHHRRLAPGLEPQRFVGHRAEALGDEPGPARPQVATAHTREHPAAG